MYLITVENPLLSNDPEIGLGSNLLKDCGYGVSIVGMDPEPDATKGSGVERNDTGHGLIFKIKRDAGLFQEMLNDGDLMRVAEDCSGYKCFHTSKVLGSAYKFNDLKVIISLNRVVIRLLICNFQHYLRFI